MKVTIDNRTYTVIATGIDTVDVFDSNNVPVLEIVGVTIEFDKKVIIEAIKEFDKEKSV